MHLWLWLSWIWQAVLLLKLKQARLRVPFWRDSFITHRAFCDALSQESARLPSGLTALGSHLYGNRSMSLGLSQVNSQLASLQDQNHPSVGLLHLGGTGGPQFDQIISPSNSSSFRSPQPQASSAYYLGHGGPNSEFGEESQPPPHHSLLQNNLFNLNFFSNGNLSTNAMGNNNSGSNQNNHHLLVNADHFGNANGSMDQSTLFSANLMSDPTGGGGVTSLYNSSLTNEQILPQMSATALLQKAAQMGATASAAANFRSGFGGGGDGFRSQMENDATAHIHDLMNSLANGGSGLFGGHEQVSNGGLAGAFGAGLCNMDEAKFSLSNAAGNLGGGSDGLTRDFLGVGSMVRSMAGGISPRDQHQRAMNSFEAEMKSASSSRSFAGGSMQ